MLEQNNPDNTDEDRNSWPSSSIAEVIQWYHSFDLIEDYDIEALNIEQRQVAAKYGW